MKKSIGTENTTLVRDARNARRPAAAAAGLAWPPPAAATAEAITICCFGQITAQTFTNISVPNRAPVKMASPQGLVMTEVPGGAWSTRFVMIAAPERKVNIAPPAPLHEPRVPVRPPARPPESVRRSRIPGPVPPLLAQLDQPLDEARGVLEVHVVVHHAVADEEPALQPFREIDGRRLLVRDAVRLRLVEDARGVGMVVVGPIGHGAKRRAGGKAAGPREHRHQRDESAVAAAVDPDARRIDPHLPREPASAVHLVVEVRAAHVSVDRRAPGAPVSCAAAVVQVEHGVAPGREQMVEHVL